MTDPDFDQALRCHKAGRLEEARQICQQILQVEANHTDALRLLALICQQAGQHDAAIELLQRLVSVMPTGAAHYNLGNAFAMQGMMDSAIAQYECALSFAPDHVETHNNLGNALTAQGKLAQAIASYQRALSFRPDHADAHTNLGNALMDSRRVAEAISHYQQAASLQPDSADIHYSLASALALQGSMESAITCYQRVLALRPDHAEASRKLGIALASLGKSGSAIASYEHSAPIHARKQEAFALLRNQRFSEARTLYAEICALDQMDAEACFFLGAVNGQLGNAAEAVDCFRRVVALSPHHALAHYNLGMALRSQGRLEDAVQALQEAARLAPQRKEVHIALAHTYVDMNRPEGAEQCYRELLKLKPDDADTHYNLGMMLHRQGRLGEAVAQYWESLRCKPDSVGVYNNLGGAYSDQGRPEESLRCHRHALDLDPDDDGTHSNILLTMHYLPNPDPARIIAEHRKWGEKHVLPVHRVYPNDRTVGRRLRVGYVSPDFRNHAVAHFFEPLLANHDGDAVEAICYSNTRRADTVTDRLRGLAGRWREIGKLSDDEAARVIRADEVDILVDLAGHTANNRLKLFAQKPAPIQVSYLGYPNTTGLPAMDYRLTDALADPPGQEIFCTEKLLRLPGGFLCYRPFAESPPVVPPPALTAGHVTFGSYNNLSKINTDVVALWAKLLGRVPGAHIFIKSPALTDSGTREYYFGLFEKCGVPRDRIELAGKTPTQAGHLAQYGHVDIALDPSPYNGTTTTCEALWMGVPVVTLAGSAHVGRVGVSLLNSGDLKEWIAETPEQYLALAAGLAGDMRGLAASRAGLRGHLAASALCDGKSFSKKVENVYRGMWKAWCDSR